MVAVDTLGMAWLYELVVFVISMIVSVSIYILPSLVIQIV